MPKKTTRAKKTAKKAVKANNECVVQEKIREDKGDKWIEKTLSLSQPSQESQIANLVYYHFLESDYGERVWAADLDDGEEKVDEIFDNIYSEYVIDREWMTEEEWQKISDNLYIMVYEGVF